MELKGSKTEKNLLAAFAGESMARTRYNIYASKAKKEGFTNIAKFFELLGSVEKEHEKRFQTLLDRIQNDEVFSSSESIYWQCRNCGYIYEGNEAPEFCPLCGHSRGYFERKKENY